MNKKKFDQLRIMKNINMIKNTWSTKKTKTYVRTVLGNKDSAILEEKRNRFWIVNVCGERMKHWTNTAVC